MWRNQPKHLMRESQWLEARHGKGHQTVIGSYNLYWLIPFLPLSMASKGSKSGSVRLKAMGQGLGNGTYATWLMSMAILLNHCSCFHWNRGDSGCFYLYQAGILNIFKWGSAKFETNWMSCRFYLRWCPGVFKDDSSDQVWKQKWKIKFIHSHSI